MKTDNFSSPSISPNTSPRAWQRAAEIRRFSIEPSFSSAWRTQHRIITVPLLASPWSLYTYPRQLIAKMRASSAYDAGLDRQRALILSSGATGVSLAKPTWPPINGLDAWPLCRSLAHLRKLAMVAEQGLDKRPFCQC